MAIYAIETYTVCGQFFDSLHEFENNADFDAAKANRPGTCQYLRRVSREEAKKAVKRGMHHSTRFWLDGNTVRG